MALNMDAEFLNSSWKLGDEWLLHQGLAGGQGRGKENKGRGRRHRARSTAAEQTVQRSADKRHSIAAGETGSSHAEVTALVRDHVITSLRSSLAEQRNDENVVAAKLHMMREAEKSHVAQIQSQAQEIQALKGRLHAVESTKVDEHAEINRSGNGIVAGAYYFPRNP